MCWWCKVLDVKNRTGSRRKDRRKQSLGLGKDKCWKPRGNEKQPRSGSLIRIKAGSRTQPISQTEGTTPFLQDLPSYHEMLQKGFYVFLQDLYLKKWQCILLMINMHSTNSMLYLAGNYRLCGCPLNVAPPCNSTLFANSDPISCQSLPLTFPSSSKLD